MSMMVSTVKIWQKNWSGYTTKNVVSLADIQHDLSNSGYESTVYNDVDEEATIVKVVTSQGIFEIGPGFTTPNGDAIAYQDSLSVCFDGIGNNESNAIKAHLTSIIES